MDLADLVEARDVVQYFRDGLRRMLRSQPPINPSLAAPP
jgi:hypothetical protein